MLTRFLAVSLIAFAPLPAAAVEIIAHRGASYDAPENTVAAIKLAWEQKADGSEFDIYLTKDRQIAVIHDATTKRTAGVDRKVAETALPELRLLDVGKWKNPKFAGEKIPTLDEMLATVPDGKAAYIEVKCGPEIVPELTRVLKATKLKPAQLPVISFNAAVIAAVKAARPDIPAYWLVSLDRKGAKPPTAAELIAKAKELRADGLDLSATASLDEAFAAEVKKAGLKLYVWTVNDAAVAKRMAKLGVDGITTDRPAWLREQLAK